MRNALSVDVEEWFQVGAFERTIDRADWDGLESRVADNTRVVLDLFDAADVKATFFTLGWVAARHPALIRDIVGRGHEVASHGWDHARVFTLTADQFRDDLARAKAAIENAAGVAVTGYRAPSFSIDARTPWAHTLLAEGGYAYSSSVAPLATDHYGWAEAPKVAHRPLADSDLIELPVSIMPVLGKTVTAGGGYFRMLPSWFTDKAIDALNADQRPAVFYFHPWEVDPDQPRVARAPLKSKIRHYSRLNAMAGKLAKLVRRHQWDRTDRVVSAERAKLA